MDSLEKLVEAFKKFPGIGPRQARRFAYHLLHEEKGRVAELAGLIGKLQGGIAICEKCFRFFSQKNPTETAIHQCALCQDQNRDQQTLMIVTQDTDINAVEQRRMYNGLYFVIGKNIELASSDPFALPRLQELRSQIIDGQRPGLKEIILAMNANTEGEHTAEVVRKSLREVAMTIASTGGGSGGNGGTSSGTFRITSLGRGLSTGTELEYSDAETLKSAIDNRR